MRYSPFNRDVAELGRRVALALVLENSQTTSARIEIVRTRAHQSKKG